MSYPYHDISINQRTVSLSDILQSREITLTPFENTTFTFIRDWISGEEKFILQTSGSTGAPKKITLTRNQLKQSALRTINALHLTPNSTALVCLDTKYIAGKMMLVRALEGNLQLVAVEPSSNPLNLLPKNIIPDFAAFVPLQLQEIANHAESLNLLNSFKAIIIGGASVNPSLRKVIQNLVCAVYATYGMTETVSHIALQRLNGKEKSDHFTLLPTINIEKDDRGCLIIQLPEFEEKIITNDLVELLDEKSFRWLGRWDTVINSGGFKISPEKVEQAVHLAFEELSIKKTFFITGLSDEKLGHQLALISEGNPLGFDEENLIRAKVKNLLHAYEVPKLFKYIPHFILTETGKINRAKTIASSYGK